MCAPLTTFGVVKVKLNLSVHEIAYIKPGSNSVRTARRAELLYRFLLFVLGENTRPDSISLVSFRVQIYC